jgi:uncharacterized OB-fold protein
VSAESMPARPLPRFPEPDTEPFYAGCREHRLTYQVCRDCGGIVFYPRSHCTHCTGTNLEWRESAGRGSIYSFTVMRQHGNPFYKTRLPMPVALVDLDEGFRMFAEIVGSDPDALRVGQRVQVSWLDEDGVSLPAFTPAQ